jgi:hypothetical protein
MVTVCGCRPPDAGDTRGSAEIICNTQPMICGAWIEIRQPDAVDSHLDPASALLVE